MADMPRIEVAPHTRRTSPPRVVWRVTLPKTKELSGRAELGSREAAFNFAHLVAGLYGWQVHEWTPEEQTGGSDG
ncbi:hypothetical protein IMZ11_02580 [Microtetraspora sp. AC03309]|uniref:hypothetical protein n=1 Tax=Microtetraspora sp. AC03309 TaxID=2779376 RepID=UPI001E556EF7|nr:hypothetical protein [Microtetraspora sp. AC03309]MCC5574525.1 hypothetical protein [Microtetraspora sp. AC03309]